MAKTKGWLAIDLDGTLVEYDGWKGIDHIGEPKIPMFKYVKELLERGVDVRIFTARFHHGTPAIMAIDQWCVKYFGRKLAVTATKDMNMVYMIDDRAFRPWDDDLPYPWEMAAMCQWHNDPNNPNSPISKGEAIPQADGCAE